MEIEDDFLIRPMQAKVAKEMIASSVGGENFFMQLNMGEGKSSVINPMVACALSNGQKLARCVVLTPLCEADGTHTLATSWWSCCAPCLLSPIFTQESADERSC